MNKRANSYDVGRAAGVSRTVVSLVINGHADRYGIAKATQARVLSAIQALGYTPNMTLRNICLNNRELIAAGVNLQVTLIAQPEEKAEGGNLKPEVQPSTPITELATPAPDPVPPATFRSPPTPASPPAPEPVPPVTPDFADTSADMSAIGPAEAEGLAEAETLPPAPEPVLEPEPAPEPAPVPPTEPPVVIESPPEEPVSEIPQPSTTNEEPGTPDPAHEPVQEGPPPVS